MTLKRTLRILSGCVCADFHRYSRRVVQRRVRKQLLSFLSTASFFCAFSTVGLAQIGIITTIAGGGPNNVLATDVPLCGPSTTALDSQQNLYVAIQCQSLVVRIDHATGILTIVAGNGSPALPPFGDGGPAVDATLVQPLGVAVDGAGNVFIADTYNYRIRRVDATTGAITTIAGTGFGDYSGDGGPASAAAVNAPYAVAFDHAGNLLVVDSGNGRIRRIDAVTGIITTIAGGGNGCNGQTDSLGDGCQATSATLHPRGVFIDSAGNLFISDSDNSLIRRVDAATTVITTVAGGGTGCIGESDAIGDGCLATSAILNHPVGLALDGAGNLLIADTDWYLVRRVDALTGIITVVAGGGSGCAAQTDAVGDGCPAIQSSLNTPYGVVFDGAGNLLISDWGTGRVRRIDAGSGVITAVAGGGTGDGLPALSTAFSSAWITIDAAGNMFMSEAGDVRRMDAATTLITRYAGGGAGCSGQLDNLGDGCLARDASVPSPNGLAVDNLGNLFIADSSYNRVRGVDAVTHVITTAAGTGRAGYTGDNGPATSARLHYPNGVAVDSAGNFFIADYINNVIRRVDAITHVITTVAGNGTAGYSGDGGPATSASLHLAEAVALDTSGNLFIADLFNHRIRRVEAATGVITTVLSDLDWPGGITLDNVGNLFFIEHFRSIALRMDAATGLVTTVAGNGTAGFSGDNGPATSAALYYPVGIAVDTKGSIFIPDNNRIRKVDLGVPAMAASATSLNFGKVKVGRQSKPQRVTITNTGTALLEFFSIAVSANFLESDTCGSGVEPGATCQISLNFVPAKKGKESGTLTIKPNVAGGSTSITLSGTGVGHAKHPHGS